MSSSCARGVRLSAARECKEIMRYFVVSDIHGYYTALINALNKSGFDLHNPSHMLIVCGDLMDRGDQALELQNYIVGLIKKRKVILVRGNHEDLAIEMLNRYKSIVKRISHSIYQSNHTFETMLQLTGMIEQDAVTNPRKFIRRAKSTKYVKKIIPRTRDYFETDKYIFVHGWIPCVTDKNLKVSDKNKTYAYDPNWRRSKLSDWCAARWYNGMDCAVKWNVKESNKTIICGHEGAIHGHKRFEDCIMEDFSPFYSNGIIAIDTCTFYTKDVNVVVIDD